MDTRFKLNQTVWIPGSNKMICSGDKKFKLSKKDVFKHVIGKIYIGAPALNLYRHKMKLDNSRYSSGIELIENSRYSSVIELIEKCANSVSYSVDIPNDLKKKYSFYEYYSGNCNSKYLYDNQEAALNACKNSVDKVLNCEDYVSLSVENTVSDKNELNIGDFCYFSIYGLVANLKNNDISLAKNNNGRLYYRMEVAAKTGSILDTIVPGIFLGKTMSNISYEKTISVLYEDEIVTLKSKAFTNSNSVYKYVQDALNKI